MLRPGIAPALLPLVLLLLVACSVTASPAGTPIGDETRLRPAVPVASATPAPTPTPTRAFEVPSLSIELVAHGLELPNTITVASDDRVYVNETHSGRVRVIDRDGAVADQPFLDFSGRIGTDGERGLLGLAFHPDYESNGRLFVDYTRVSDGAVVVSELTRAEGGRTAEAASERVLLTVAHPTAYHNAGELQFGPEGYLYVGIGDGGSLGDSLGNAQNPDALLGKILRIDVDSVPDPGKGYAIPFDNPFAGGGGAPEVYVVGLRNPWRFSFDSETDALWVADLGEGAYEEVTRLDADIAAGANLGWSVTEGSRCYNLLPCDTSPFVAPVTEYSRDIGCAVIGGYVERGGAIQGLAGWYLFADYCTGAILGIPADARADADDVIDPRLLLATGLQISTLGMGPAGELYLADITSGDIYRLVAEPG